MINSKNICAILSGVPLLLLTTTSSYADMVKNERELALLPQYCHATRQVISISKLPQSAFNNNLKIYGETYNHLHHYCWALMSEYNANGIQEKGPRRNKLSYALNDIQYVLNKNPPDTFQPLAEIYASRARILFKLDRPSEAVADLIKAINLQPGYLRAYAQLSDYYLQIGQKDKAISLLEKGVENHESPTLLLKELDRLGKPYKGTPGSALTKTQEVAPSATDQATSSAEQSPSNTPPSSQNATGDVLDTGKPPTADSMQQEGKTTEPAPPKNPANPYCRFCP